MELGTWSGRSRVRHGGRPTAIARKFVALRTCSKPASNETGALRGPALRDAVSRRPITRRCRGRRPGRTRRTGSCSSDRSRREDARRRARPPPIHRWRTSIRHLALHTSRTSASPSVPSLDHPPRYRDRNAGGEPHRRELLHTDSMLRRAPPVALLLGLLVFSPSTKPASPCVYGRQAR